MKTTKNKLGFTLIELLAVIVILGVIMMIAIPSVTNYITGARADSFVDTAKELIGAVRNYAITENLLPQYEGNGVIFNLKEQSLEKGGAKSPFGKEWDEDYFYVVIAAGKINETTQAPNYFYFFGGNDTSGNMIPLTEESVIEKALVGNAGSKKAAQDRMDADIASYSLCTTCSTADDNSLNITGDGKANYNNIKSLLEKNGADFSDTRYVKITFKDKSYKKDGTDYGTCSGKNSAKCQHGEYDGKPSGSTAEGKDILLTLAS